jgi:hypothetical protein
MATTNHNRGIDQGFTIPEAERLGLTTRASHELHALARTGQHLLDIERGRESLDPAALFALFERIGRVAEALLDVGDVDSEQVLSYPEICSVLRYESVDAAIRSRKELRS